MKKVLLIGMAVAFMLSAGVAMAGNDTFQTLGTVSSVDQTAYTPMTGEELNAVEGKWRNYVPFYKPQRHHKAFHKRHFKPGHKRHFKPSHKRHHKPVHRHYTH